jgi:hypothetical protein
MFPCRQCWDHCLYTTPMDPWALLTRVLLRRVFFLNTEKSRYVSVGFYPAHDHQIFVEFGGSRIQPITFTEQHVKTFTEHLPELCDAMYLGKRYTCKDDVFKLLCSGTDNVARIYQKKGFVTFKRYDLRYLMNMLHLVQDQQTRCILARDDVAYALLARGSCEFVEPQLFVDSYCTTNCFTKSKHCSYKTIV